MKECYTYVGDLPDLDQMLQNVAFAHGYKWNGSAFPGYSDNGIRNCGKNYILCAEDHRLMYCSMTYLDKERCKLSSTVEFLNHLKGREPRIEEPLLKFDAAPAARIKTSGNVHIAGYSYNFDDIHRINDEVCKMETKLAAQAIARAVKEIK